MKILILCVGKLKEDYFRAAEAEYRKRLRPYCQVDVVEHKDESSLLAAISSGSVVVALDERGKEMTSPQFATMLEKHGMSGRGETLVFAIGGPDGHSDAVRAQAHHLLAFGRMTIGHRFMRPLLLEQIYRGFRIMRGEPYHR